MPRVTVYIPAYNHERFVGGAIRSVLAQTFADFELLVVDDASTDGTLAEIRRFDDPRLKVFAMPHNRGASANANFCIAQAKGDYVTPLGSDDFIHPDKLRRQVEFLDGHPELLAVTAQPVFVDEEGRERRAGHPFAHLFTQENRSREAWLRQFFLNGNCLCHPTAMIRRQVYQQIGGYHELMRQLPDFDFWVRLCLAGSLHVMPDELTFFRVQDNQGNVSAPSVQNYASSQHEEYLILRHYLQPAVLQQIGRIFGPEWEESPSPKLALAEIAWQVNRPPHRMFAVQTMLDTRLEPLAEAPREEQRRRIRSMLLKADVFREMECDRWRTERREWQSKVQALKDKMEEVRAKLGAIQQDNERMKRSWWWHLSKPVRLLQSWFNRSPR